MTGDGATMSKKEPLDPEFLEKYERESTWAPSVGTTQRTSKRYRDQGMPWLFWGGIVYIPRSEGSEYIASRVKRRNPRRPRRAIAAATEIGAS
jgi:hypothetical protein